MNDIWIIEHFDEDIKKWVAIGRPHQSEAAAENGIDKWIHDQLESVAHGDLERPMVHRVARYTRDSAYGNEYPDELDPTISYTPGDLIEKRSEEELQAVRDEEWETSYANDPADGEIVPYNGPVVETVPEGEPYPGACCGFFVVRDGKEIQITAEEYYNHPSVGGVAEVIIEPQNE